MVRELPGSWSVFAKATGRIDPWPLLDALGGVEGLSRADPHELVRAGLPLDLAAQAGAAAPLPVPVPFVLAGEADYPARLLRLPHAPPVLFYQGSLEALNRPGVAIVGARRCTAEGRRTAAELARAVCLAGGVVVSGMAMGIDTAAHREALELGTTVAVLGQGLAVRRSSGAQRLVERIVGGGGLVLSEFLPSFAAKPFTFLLRNRVIAGLCRATVVVEAGHRSGSLNTARHALEAGREVLAVPGGVRAECSQGCLTLIEQGATMVRGASTVLRAAGLCAGPPSERAGEPEDDTQRLLRALDQGKDVEALAAATGQPMVRVIAALAELEAVGLIRRLPGRRYQLTR